MAVCRKLNVRATMLGGAQLMLALTSVPLSQWLAEETCPLLFALKES